MQADQSWLFRFGDCFFSLKEIRFFVVDLVLDEYFFLRAEKTNDKKRQDADKTTSWNQKMLDLIREVPRDWKDCCHKESEILI